MAASFSDIVDLKAVEHAPLMEQAFAADSVDLFVGGDWEETQVELGLKRARTTPPELRRPAQVPEAQAEVETDR